MRRTISAMVGKGSVNHNSRKFRAENVDGTRTHFNIDYCNENIKAVYHQIFDDALEQYNAKQTRADRKIEDYYEKICSGKQEKPFHELILQIGNREDMAANSENGALAQTCLDEYYQNFQVRNPNLRVFSAHLHMDEATPHLHIDFVPFTTGSKRSLNTRVSLKQALAAQGFKGGTRGDTEWNQWVRAEKEQLAAVMERHGIEWEQLGLHNEHLSVLDYKKQEHTKEVKALDAAKAKIEKDLAYHENRLKELAPAVENMEKLALEFSNDPDQILPEASRMESARAYRERKAKPFAEKVVKVLRSLYSAYLDLKHSFGCLQEQYYREVKGASALSERVDELISQRELLRKEVQDYNRVKKVLGIKQINEAIEAAHHQEQMKKQRNRNLKMR